MFSRSSRKRLSSRSAYRTFNKPIGFLFHPGGLEYEVVNRNLYLQTTENLRPRKPLGDYLEYLVENTDWQGEKVQYYKQMFLLADKRSESESNVVVSKVLILFKGTVLVPSCIKSFHSEYCGKGQMKYYHKKSVYGDALC
ncbi:hypothetical protein E5288_WYG017827 [Bos mutus]|uniref:Uncharacterized protein n=1 Tax=Bos mutus TaxID=72004 RepID=A0A6B0SB15_9CETA|nr:hypothetical protein [Bos mutus]